MKFFLILALLSEVSFASGAKRYFQDAKFPTQKMVESLTISAPVSGLANNLLYVSSGISGATSAAAATVTSGLTNPDVARNLVITPYGTTSDIGTCSIVVSGKSVNNTSISETFAFTSSQSTSITGNSAFKSLTSVAFPASCETGGFAADWKIGIGNKFGVPRCLAYAGDIVSALMDGVKEATLPTMAADVDEVEKNTATFNTAPNGVHNYILYYFQNYRCSP